MKNQIKNVTKDEKMRKQAIVDEIKSDFSTRQMERKVIESKWRLNINFVMGNQYCYVGSDGEVVDYDKKFYWQEREVFNHLANIVDVRLSKLGKMRPLVTVIPASGEIRDINSAKMSKSIIEGISHKISLQNLISDATAWSEICGTSFYKVIWNKDTGKVIDFDNKKFAEGEIEISVVPPFEIYPTSSSIANLADNPSIIHARCYDASVVKMMHGVEVEPTEMDIYSLSTTPNAGGFGYTQSVVSAGKATKTGVLVLEKYELPTVEFPNGRLQIIAGEELVYEGDLPYINGVDGTRGYPFVKQVSISLPGVFWGSCVVERGIPVQRSYNAIKNRKNEFLNRLSMGVLMVEEGAVDTDNLEDEGLCPGKVITYRQGSNPPAMMATNRVPVDFASEENRLLSEFSIISGISDLLRQSNASLTQLSGNALQILIEQDEGRLSTTIDSINSAIAEIGSQILRLYKQFANTTRLMKLIGDNGLTEVFYFNSCDVGSDDVKCVTEYESSNTPAQRRSMVYELLSSGLLQDENGKMSNSTRAKILDMLGLGVWESDLDINALQIKNAQRENLEFAKNKPNFEVCEIDEHELHIKEHIAYLLSNEGIELRKNKEKYENALKHIRAHKQFREITNQIETKNVEN